jgi:hypothetical protein
MAIESDVKKKRRGGWIEVEEPATASPSSVTEPTVTGMSDISFVSGNFDRIYKAIIDKIGVSLWQAFVEGRTDLTPEQRVDVLLAATGKKFLWGEDVQSLLASNDAALSPQLIRIGQEYLQRLEATFQRYKELLKEIRSGATQ